MAAPIQGVACQAPQSSKPRGAGAEALRPEPAEELAACIFLAFFSVGGGFISHLSTRSSESRFTSRPLRACIFLAELIVSTASAFITTNSLSQIKIANRKCTNFPLRTEKSEQVSRNP